MYIKIDNDYKEIYLKYGYLTFPLNLSVVPKIKIGGETYFSKSGYHISLLCLDNLSEEKQKEILIFAKKYQLKLRKVTSIFRLVKQDQQGSIIVRVRLKGLKKLISAVNKHFGYHFPYPPVHITLFTFKGQFGIGIKSKSDYKRLTSKIGLEDSVRLHKSFEI